MKSGVVSKAEHKLILVVAFAAFILAISGLNAYNVKSARERTEYYKQQEESASIFVGRYCFPDRHPEFLLWLVLILGSNLITLFLAKKFIFSAFSSAASFLMFVYWFRDTRELLFDNEGASHVIGLDRIFYKAGNFDVAAFVLVSVILFWQISILLRILIKTVQRKYVLP